MTKKQFEVRLQHIEEQADAAQARVDGYRDQQLAALFVDSGWSQEELAEFLAKKWGKEVSADWVSKRLRLGRFLSFFNTSGIEDRLRAPRNLTEREFRKFWEATEPAGNFSGHSSNTTAAVEDEKRRFGLVREELLQAGLTRQRKPLRKAIIKKLANKTTALTIAEIVALVADELPGSVTNNDVDQTLSTLTPNTKSPYRVEKIGAGVGAKYRIVKAKGQVITRKQLSKLSGEMLPLFDQLFREMAKDRVLISHAELLSLASRLRQVLQSVVGEAAFEAPFVEEEVSR